MSRATSAMPDLRPVGLGQDRQHRRPEVQRVVVRRTTRRRPCGRRPGRRGRGVARPPAARAAAAGRRGRRRRRLAAPAVAGSGSGSSDAADLVLQAGDELLEQLVGDVLHDAAAELRRLAGDRQVGDHVDLGGARALLGDGRGDRGAGGAVAALVLALGVDDEPVGGLVLLHEGAGAVVDQRDRAELDLAGALEVVAVDLGDGGAREAAPRPTRCPGRSPRCRRPRPGR